MTTALTPSTVADPAGRAAAPPDTLGQRVWANGRVRVGGGVLLAILIACLSTLPLTLRGSTPGRPAGDFYYDGQHAGLAQRRPCLSPAWQAFGTTKLGQSLLGRCLLGGVVSLSIGLAAAAVSVALGVGVGLVAGYHGGWVDAVLMRVVDVLYALPYILMVVLLKIALQRPLRSLGLASGAVNLGVLFLAIGLVSWLTMARVVRGQVLSLRAMPFVDAARATGAPEWRIFARHLLPNLVGPIAVYATLTVPGAILEESVLSFLGIGIQPPLPTWGSLASEGLELALNPVASQWWLLLFPCILLAVTLLGLNFLGDGLRDVFDPKRAAAQV